MELKEAIQQRKSEREFSGKHLTEEQKRLFHWVAYKVPSAGALYPLELILVEDLLYYNSKLPNVYVICADFNKTCNKYGERGIKYVYMEAGHTAQNISLLATELGLVHFCIGAFDEKAMQRLLNTELIPIYMVALGERKNAN